MEGGVPLTRGASGPMRSGSRPSQLERHSVPQIVSSSGWVTPSGDLLQPCSLSNYSQASKNKVSKHVKTLFLVVGGVPLASSLVFGIMKYSVLSDALSYVPETFEKLNPMCAGGTMGQVDQRRFCYGMRSRCAQWLSDTEGQQYLYGESAQFMQEDARQCEPKYNEFVEAVRSELFMRPTWVILAALSVGLFVTPCGIIGAMQDDKRFTFLFALLNAIVTVAYIVPVVLTCQCMFTVHVAMYSTGAYWGYILYDRQQKTAAAPLLPLVQTQVSQPQLRSQSSGASRDCVPASQVEQEVELHPQTLSRITSDASAERRCSESTQSTFYPQGGVTKY